MCGGPGPPIGSASEIGNDPRCAGLFIARTRRPADKNLPPTWRLARAAGLERPDDRDLVNRRAKSRVPVEIKMHIQRLPFRFQQRRALLEERDADLMRPR